jgi:hypothetical protein
MRLRSYAGIAGLVGLLSSVCAIPVQAHSTPPPGTNPPPAGQTGPVNVPTATGGQDDKNYTATSFNATTNALLPDAVPIRGVPNKPKPVQNPCDQLLRSLPPDRFYGIDFQERSYRHASPIYIPSLYYADNRAGFDVSAHGYGGAITGEGGTIRWDLTESRRQYVKMLVDLKHKISAAMGGSGDDCTQYLPDLKNVEESYIHSTRALRVAGFVGDNSIDDVGNFINAGISVSSLWRLAGNSPKSSAGLTPLLSVEGVQYNPDHGATVVLPDALQRRKAYVRVGTAITFQNDTLYPMDVKSPTNGKMGTKIGGIWKYQVGLEFVFRNAADQADTLSAFFRYRVCEHFRVAVFGGIRSDHEDYVGSSLSFNFH